MDSIPNAGDHLDAQEASVEVALEYCCKINV